MARDLKTILGSLTFTDDAKVAQQLAEHSAAVARRMASVRRKVLVMSGKGGVGKSTVTAQLALALARAGKKVGVLDVDLNGPCIPTLLGVQGQAFRIDRDGAEPVEGPHGIKIASLEFLLRSDAPTRWTGPMELSPVWLGSMELTILRELLSDVNWGDLDWWLADLPPGAAADKPPALAGLIPDIEGAVIVTTPSPIAMEVVRRSVSYAREAGIRPLGLIINMSADSCPQCGHRNEELLGLEKETEEWARSIDLPVLAGIPYDHSLGRDLPSNGTHPGATLHGHLFDQAAKTLETLLEGT